MKLDRVKILCSILFLTACIAVSPYITVVGNAQQGTAVLIGPVANGEILATPFSNFSAAVHAPVVNGYTLLIVSPMSCNNVTVPSGVGLHITQGGSIAPSSGKTLTIGGAFNVGLYKVFAGAGTVFFSNRYDARPEWWGANPWNSTVDSTAAINTASNSTLAGLVTLSSGVYYFSNILLNNGGGGGIVGETGSMWNHTLIRLSGSTGTAITEKGNSSTANAAKLFLRNFVVNLNNVNGPGVVLGYTNTANPIGTEGLIDNILVRDVGGTNYALDLNTNAAVIRKITVWNTVANTNSTNLRISGGSSMYSDIILSGVGLHLLELAGNDDTIRQLYLEAGQAVPVLFNNSPFNTINGVRLSVGASNTVTSAFTFSGTSAVGNKIYDCDVNTSQSGSAITNFINESTIGYVVPWVGNGSYNQSNNPYQTRTISTTTTLDNYKENGTIFVSGSISVTLPTSNKSFNQEITFIKTDSGTTTTITTNTGTLNGSSGYSLTTQYKSIRVRCDGTNWYIVSLSP